ncbi:MAG: PLP-dependent aminotransferase family protein [Gammaproteobacteria bacterium]|nr:PLP-dependent aminotransferase family protein [Gammaproteobacteria bacterium]
MTVQLDIKSENFLYDQVSRYIVDLIDNGNLKPGDKAPSLRKLSKNLKVSISTVNQAYLSLETQGVLKAKPQSGFYVNAVLEKTIKLPKCETHNGEPKKVKFGKIFEEVFSMANDPTVVPFGAAKPSIELMPVKGLIRATNRMAARRPNESLDYCFPPGHKRLREQIALQYQELGLSISADEIITTSGATEALSISLQAVAKRGDIIAVESPTYFAVLRMIESMGMMALEIETDPETGVVLESLREALETMDIKVFLAVPNFSNPIGSLMPDENKKAMVELLEFYNVPMIEDDVYGDLYFGDERPKMAKHYDNKQMVLSCSSYSKALAPGYRVGWVLPGKFYDRVLEWKQATFSATASLLQMGVAEFLASGDYGRHLVRLRKALRQQVEKGRFMVAQTFPKGTRISSPQGGFVLWVELPKGVSCLDVFNIAEEKRIGITPGILFSATRKYKNYIRINCGFPWNETNERAMQDLAQIVKDLS